MNFFSHDRRKNYDRYMESSHHPKEGMTFILNKTCKIFHISALLSRLEIIGPEKARI